MLGTFMLTALSGVLLRDDDDGAGCVLSDLGADRAEQGAEAAFGSGADDEQRCATLVGHGQQC